MAKKSLAAIAQVVAKFTPKQQEAFEAAAAELKKVEQFRAPRDPQGRWGRDGGLGLLGRCETLDIL